MPVRLIVLVLLAGCTSVGEGRRGCDVPYPEADDSLYVLPFLVLPFLRGTTVSVGLANCSTSFHGAGEPDELAFDFDAPTGTPFYAAPAGRVIGLDEDASSAGGGVGNYVLLDHGDGTAAYYLHSPADGIDVGVGDHVEAGDRLGVVGRSGQAGYPHLHFVVIEGSPTYPYEDVPVAFRNARPADVPLQSYSRYEVTAR